MSDPLYFRKFEQIYPKPVAHFAVHHMLIWRFLAMFGVGLAAWYLAWRWQYSFNPGAPIFSHLVFWVEVAAFVGTLLFFYDIWDEPDPRPIVMPDPQQAGGDKVDIFIATLNEDLDLLRDSIRDAVAVRVPTGWTAQVYVLDDGARPDLKKMCRDMQVAYFQRTSNRGYKAGNLKNAMLHTDGDFVVVADADTRLQPTFLENTLGYFHDAKVAWVQTPHWFYDLPTGRPLQRFLGRRLCQRLGLNDVTIGADPYISDPSMFFDIIQRRRDRHGASFCCGAGSIHRREVLFEVALDDPAPQSPADVVLTPLEPFKFHVSEDIYTSIKIHETGRYTSVFHPNIETRMLSPWSLQAWSLQRLKYAKGTFDIMLKTVGLFPSKMPWQMKLHYLATFWSYFAVIPFFIMFFAPIYTLFTGVTPVASFSFDFFLHLIPVLLVMEAALVWGCKGYDVQASRILSAASAPLVLRGLCEVILGRKIGFDATPKMQQTQTEFGAILPQIFLLLLCVVAVLWGLFHFFAGTESYTAGMMVVNLFWVGWNSIAFVRLLLLAAKPLT